MCLSDVGFEVPDKFVVGYALDYNEYFRDLNVSIEKCIRNDQSGCMLIRVTRKSLLS